MIHQQVHVKDMFVWVYVFLSPGITCSLAQACWSKTWAAWHDVCAFAEKKHLGSRHRQIRSDSKIKASQLQSPRFSAESSHKIISGVLECYGKHNGSPPLQKNLLEFLPTFCMWKAKGPKNPAHFLYILGRCQISILQLSFLESQPCRGSVIAVPQSVETWCFFQVGEASGQTWRCSEPRVTQRFLRVKSDLKLANVPPESSTQGLLALRAWNLNLEKNWSHSHCSFLIWSACVIQQRLSCL